jgi:hypothetical protein
MVTYTGLNIKIRRDKSRDARLVEMVELPRPEAQIAQMPQEYQIYNLRVKSHIV